MSRLTREVCNRQVAEYFQKYEVDEVDALLTPARTSNTADLRGQQRSRDIMYWPWCTRGSSLTSADVYTSSGSGLQIPCMHTGMGSGAEVQQLFVLQ